MHLDLLSRVAAPALGARGARHAGQVALATFLLRKPVFSVLGRQIGVSFVAVACGAGRRGGEQGHHGEALRAGEEGRQGEVEVALKSASVVPACCIWYHR